MKTPTASAPPATQRRRPPGAEEQHKQRSERLPCGDEPTKCDDEAENRGEDDAARVGVHTRVERRLHVVEVEEAVPEPRGERAGQVLRMQKRDTEGERRSRKGHDDDQHDACSEWPPSAGSSARSTTAAAR